MHRVVFTLTCKGALCFLPSLYIPTMMGTDKFCLPVPDLQINNLWCAETMTSKNTLLEPSKGAGHII